MDLETISGITPDGCVGYLRRGCLARDGFSGGGLAGDGGGAWMRSRNQEESLLPCDACERDTIAMDASTFMPAESGGIWKAHRVSSCHNVYLILEKVEQSTRSSMGERALGEMVGYVESAATQQDSSAHM